MYLKLGYKARTFNSDFIFTRKYQNCIVDIHQGLEPAHPVYSALIDFEIEDAVVVIKNNESNGLSGKTIDQIRELFDFVYQREQYFFCMSRNMDFNDSRLEKTVLKLDEILY